MYIYDIRCSLICSAPGELQGEPALQAALLKALSQGLVQGRRGALIIAGQRSSHEPQRRTDEDADAEARAPEEVVAAVEEVRKLEEQMHHLREKKDDQRLKRGNFKGLKIYLDSRVDLFFFRFFAEKRFSDEIAFCHSCDLFSHIPEYHVSDVPLPSSQRRIKGPFKLHGYHVKTRGVSRDLRGQDQL